MLNTLPSAEVQLTDVVPLRAVSYIFFKHTIYKQLTFLPKEIIP